MTRSLPFGVEIALTLAAIVLPVSTGFAQTKAPVKPIATKGTSVAPVLGGTFQGTLHPAPTAALTLIFQVSRSNGDVRSTLDVPEQGVKSFPVTKTSVIGDVVVFALDRLGATFSGKVSQGGATIIGTFTQGGQSYPLTLARTTKPRTLDRPQTPVPPFPYRSDEVSYPNSKTTGIILGGTLTLPSGTAPFPTVLFITGSGQQDRDETILGHKPFAVIADYLARHGIASLRLDDRGIGKSTGDPSRSTSADYADDVRAGIAYLQSRPEVNSKQIGLIGHSEGGMIAPMVAASNPDVFFIVLLAGTGVPGDLVLSGQRAAIERAMGVSDQQIQQAETVMARLTTVAKNTTDPAAIPDAMKKAVEDEVLRLPEGVRDQARTQLAPTVSMMAQPWMGYFLRFDPATVLQSVSCPVLALNGSLDLQVLPKQNLPAIAAALQKANNKDVTIRELPGLNHLFQHAKTGLPAEYVTISETVSPEVLTIVSNWITERTAKSVPGKP